MQQESQLADSTRRRGDDTPEPANYVAEVLKLLPQLMRGLDARTPGHAYTHGASPAQMKAILHLAEYGPQTMGELARGLGITTPSATGLVGPLVDKGLVHRERDAMDRRVVRVSLSEQAREMGERLIRQRRQEIAGALEDMDEEAQEHFLEGLKRLVHIYNGHSA